MSEVESQDAFDARVDSIVADGARLMSEAAAQEPEASGMTLDRVANMLAAQCEADAPMHARAWALHEAAVEMADSAARLAVDDPRVSRDSVLNDAGGVLAALMAVLCAVDIRPRDLALAGVAKIIKTRGDAAQGGDDDE